MSLFFGPSRKLAAERLERGGSRVYDPRERLALTSFDALLRVVSPFLGLRPSPGSRPVEESERVLCLRLDRLGDLLMTLPALQSLRRAAPNAALELAVGSWNEPVAKRLPFIDRVRVVDAPSSAWGRRASWHEADRALRDGERPDLALDFQGDVRALVLMARTRARWRAGFAETGGGCLLTHRAPWDERRSWYWQNDVLVQAAFPDAEGGLPPFNFVTESDRESASHLLSTDDPRPKVGIHPSAGRAIKEWEEEKFAALIDRLDDRVSVLVTGSEADRPLIDRIVERSKVRPSVRVGSDLPTFAALVESLQVLVSGDTGPMHLAHAVGTPSVAIFGPSDPTRYGPPPSLVPGRVVRHQVYCSPCNMIRRPPSECLEPPSPECLSGISVEQVESAVQAMLAP